jgi:outer membrane protein TolC
VSLALFVLAAPPALTADPKAEVSAPRQTLSLPDLVRDALRTNLAYQSARVSAQSVETGVLAAQGAFDPLLQASPSYSRGATNLLLQPDVTTSGTQTGRALFVGVAGTLPISTLYSAYLDHFWQNQDNPAIATMGQNQPSASTSLTLTLSQPVLRGAGPAYAKAPLSIAKLAARSAEERLDRSMEQTIAGVESAYWTLGLSEAIERLSHDSHQRAEDLLNRNQKMRALALISDVDLITSRRAVQARLTSLTEASRRRQDAADQLLFFVYGDTAASKFPDLASSRTEPPPSAASQISPSANFDSLALDQRSDIKAFQLEVQQASISEMVARNAILPDVFLTGSLIAQTRETDAFRLFTNSRAGDTESSDWRIGITFSYPLSNRTAKASYQKSVWDSRSRSLALATAETSVRTEVRTAARAVNANALRLEQAQLSFDLARQQYEAGQKQLQLGLIDSFRLLQMEDDITTAELVLVQVKYDLAQAITSYELATGTIKQKYPPARDETPGKP